MNPKPGSTLASAEHSPAEAPAIMLGSDNGCSDNSLNRIQRRAPRVGLKGSRYTRHNVYDRLDARTDRSAGADACWPVAGYRTGRGGYVQLMVDPTTKSREYAHRLSYKRAHGPLPAGLVVCHRCDNPICVNPAHLFAATQAANVRDSHDKGRFTAWHRTGRRLSGDVSKRHAHLLHDADLPTQGLAGVSERVERLGVVV